MQIQYPGFTTVATFDENSVPPLTPQFIRTFNACELEVQTTGCGSTYNNIADGIYVIRLSVSPNDIVYAEYNHLRITQAMQLWQDQMCALELGACAIPAEKQAMFEELMEIKGLLEGAVSYVEWCKKVTKGQELYNYALKRLKKLDCSTC